MAKKPPAVALRKPPAPVDPVEADRFVDAGDKTSERSDVQTSFRAKPASVRSKSKSLVERRDGRTLKRMTVYLPVDLAKRLAMHCVQNDRDVSDTITEAVRRMLGRRS
jgi:hypothetical protein